ncbi:MAG: hypothetical protein R6U96_13725 [Promethearchaeia archaeon]
MENLKKIRNIIIITVFLFSVILLMPMPKLPRNTVNSGKIEKNPENDLDFNTDPLKNAGTIANGSLSNAGNPQNVSLYHTRKQGYEEESTSDGGLTIDNPDYPQSEWNMTDFELNFTRLHTTGKYVPFEIRNDGSDTFSEEEVRYATSFTVPNTCYLNNISLFLQYWGGNNTFGSYGNPSPSKFSINIYNSTLNTSKIEPDSPINKSQDETIIDLTEKNLDQPARWYQANFSQRMLNISNTYNRTFFAVFESIDFPSWGVDAQDAYFYYANNQSGDEYNLRFYKDSGSKVWSQQTGRNGMMKVNLDPLNKSPDPQQVNLTVFNTDVNNSGLYQNHTFYPHESNTFDIPIHSPWFSPVEYDVTFEGQFRYNTVSSNTFNASLNTDVLWNSSLSIQQFPDAAYNKKARFFKPNYWAHNSTYNESSFYTDSDENSDYVDILNATNHKWNIIFNQTYNIIEHIDCKKSSKKEKWYNISALANVNITDYINISSTLKNDEGSAWMNIYSDTSEISEEKEVTDNYVEFPLWRPDLNTSITENNSKIDVQLMTSNGTIAGISSTSFNVVNSELNLTLLDAQSQVLKNEQANFNFSLQNEYNGENIDPENIVIHAQYNSGAWNLLDQYEEYKVSRYKTGNFNITLDTSHDYFKAGNYSLNITIENQYYNNSTHHYDNLEVDFRSHNLTIKGADNPNRIYRLGDYAKYSLYLNDSRTGEGLDGMELSLKTNLSGESKVLESAAYRISDDNQGNYNVTILTDILYEDKELKNITIEFYTEKEGIYSENNKNDTLKIVSEPRTTKLSILSNSSTRVIAGDPTWISMRYNDTENEENLTDANFQLYNETTSLPTKSYDIEESSDNYNITFDLNYLDIGYYNLSIVANRSRDGSISYKEAKEDFEFTFWAYPSEISIPEDYQNQSLYQEETLEMLVVLKDTFRHQDIVNANVRMKIEGLPYSNYFSELASDFGWYEGLLDLKDLDPGKYEVHINMTAEHYQSVTNSVNITVLEKETPSLKLLTKIRDSYVWEDTISFEFKLATGDKPIQNQEIKIIITKIYEDGSIEEETLSATTDNEGYAKTDYAIQKVKSFDFSIIYNGTAQYRSAEQTKKNIEVRSPSEQFVNEITPYIPFLIGTVIALTGYGLYRRSKKKKLEKEWQKKTGYFLDAINVEYILVIHKEGGVALIKQNYGQIEFDGDLISGFLHAITNFKYEIKNDTERRKRSITTLDYQDYQILLKDGEYIRVGLILGGAPSENLKGELDEFIEKFETAYEKPLKDFRGDLAGFEGYQKLINDVFNLTLNNPHVVNKTPPAIDLSNFQKRIISVARRLEEDTEAFFISKLLNYLMSMMEKTPKEKIIANIYDLRETGFLEPIQFE